MKLSRRQTDIVNSIVKEEIQGALNARRLSEEHTRRAVLNEYGPGNLEDRVDTSALEHEVETTIHDIMFDAFDDEAYAISQKAHNRFVRELYKATQKYGMGWTSPSEVASLLSVDDNDDVNDAQYELFSSIQHAINDYGKNLAKALIKAARPEGGDVE